MAAADGPPTAEGRPPLLSFRDAVKRPQVPIQEITDIKGGSSFKGEPALFYTQDEVTQLAAPFDQVLVGKFSGVRPNMEFLRKGFQIIGFKGDVSLGLLDSNHILIRFGLHDDYYRCWMRGSWTFKKHVMKVLKWTPNFTADHEPPVAPVWVSFTHLPIHMFQKGPLMSLSSLIGRPLRIDAATRSLSRPSVARVCIEVNLLRHLPTRIWIGHGDSGFWQTVTYDNLPTYCSICSRLGHSDGGCSTVVPPVAPPQQIWKPKPSPNVHPHTSGLTTKDKASVPVDVPEPVSVPDTATVFPQLDALPLPTGCSNPTPVPAVPAPERVSASQDQSSSPPLTEISLLPPVILVPHVSVSSEDGAAVPSDADEQSGQHEVLPPSNHPLTLHPTDEAAPTSLPTEPVLIPLAPEFAVREHMHTAEPTVPTLLDSPLISKEVGFTKQVVEELFSEAETTPENDTLEIAHSSVPMLNKHKLVPGPSNFSAGNKILLGKTRTDILDDLRRSSQQLNHIFEQRSLAKHATIMATSPLVDQPEMEMDDSANLTEITVFVDEDDFIPVQKKKRGRPRKTVKK